MCRILKMALRRDSPSSRVRPSVCLSVRSLARRPLQLSRFEAPLCPALVGRKRVGARQTCLASRATAGSSRIKRGPPGSSNEGAAGRADRRRQFASLSQIYSRQARNGPRSWRASEWGGSGPNGACFGARRRAIWRPGRGLGPPARPRGRANRSGKSNDISKRLLAEVEKENRLSGRMEPARRFEGGPPKEALLNGLKRSRPE